ncbi:MAG TPA: helix-turn-helix domain-containing protein [Candidatus Paenibacillus intestinavium]|nr:helix-turn-helix domain-containing protein [Candidatus Paenibacillus intestinavium]
MSNIGENIRKLRKKIELTQIEFAKQIGVSQGTLSDIEQGNCNPSIETLMSIHERCRVSIHWLLKGYEEPPTGNSEVFNQSQNDLFNVIRLLPEKAVLEVLEYAKNKVM